LHLGYQVNPGSLAERAGLKVGDILVKISNRSAENMLHKEAEDAIKDSGNYLDIVVLSEGPGSTGSYRTPLQVKVVPPPPPPKPKTVPRPVSAVFETQSHVPLMNKQYNSPINLYSMKNIKDVIESHSQVLAPGVVGINFMKPEASVNTHSPVYQAVLEEEERKAAQGASGARTSPCFRDSTFTGGHHPGSSPTQFNVNRADLPPEQQYHEVLRDTSMSPSIQSNSFRRLQDTFGSNVVSNNISTNELNPSSAPSVPLNVPSTSSFLQKIQSNTVSSTNLKPQERTIPISSVPSVPSSTLSWMEMMNDKRGLQQQQPSLPIITSSAPITLPMSAGVAAPVLCPTCGQTIPGK